MRLSKITTDGHRWTRIGFAPVTSNPSILQCCQVTKSDYPSHLELLHRERSSLLKTILLLPNRFLTSVRNDSGVKTAILALLLFSFSLFADSSTTTLTDLKQIEIFNDVTSRIRCICLPSLPIKSCSFNNCAISAQLKLFMENRIRKGETANEIVQKMQTGFGEEILSDPIVQKLQASGSENMVAGLINGFGEKILAQPDSTWINSTLFIGMALGLGLIFYYLKGRLKKDKSTQEVITKNAIPEDAEKYLKEIDG
ncbi:MAG: cytochrome c-type biogenesis protein CcmH [Leptospiraceae bacterium]|nr:cytochrome c-type biogenesis protein CcmH [Leptospiraceae bacterium]